MQCYTELTPSTAVTHVECLPLLGPRRNDFVVAKTSLLQIFELRNTVTEVTANTDQSVEHTFKREADTSFVGNDISPQRTEITSKLTLVSEYALHGVVTSLKKVSLIKSKSGGKALLVSTKDAKVSLVEWDPEAYKLCTISIHYYEGEELHRAPWSPSLAQCRNYLIVDPSSRCAALKFGQRNLAIIPFRQAGDEIGEHEYGSDVEDDSGAESEVVQTPYTSSFVLPLTVLDPNITHLIDINFLYEYREPTFGIVSSPIAPSGALLRDRKDCLVYTVFTLDLDQRASTTLLSVGGLPYDIFQVKPLPAPVGGSLLIGCNEIVHIDQAGKTAAVAVNEFARQCSSFPMADQNELGLKLEGCVLEQLGSDTGDVLIILSSGDLAIVSFKLDGRSVASFSIERIAKDCGGSILPAGPTCTANAGRSRILVGSEYCDTALIGYTRRTSNITRKRSRADMLEEIGDISAEEDDLDDSEDDLYAPDSTNVGNGEQVSSNGHLPTDYTFRIHDMLQNLAPIDKTILVESQKSSTNSNSTNLHSKTKQLQVVGACGYEKSGGLFMMTRRPNFTTLSTVELLNAQGIWCIHARKPVPRGLPKIELNEDSEAVIAANADYDQLLFVSRLMNDGSEESTVYDISDDNISEKENSDFEPEATVEVGTLNNGCRIIQVLKNEIRSYDSGKLPITVVVSKSGRAL